MHRTLRLCSPAIACLMISGCGSDELNSVSGTVTLDGQPLKGAFVTFSPAEGGRPASAETDDEGRYELQYSRTSKGTGAGKYVVTIRTGTSTDEGEEIPEKLPARYHDEAADNPEMRVEVTPGGNTFDFKLTSKGAEPGGPRKKRRNPDECGGDDF